MENWSLGLQSADWSVNINDRINEKSAESLRDRASHKRNEKRGL